MKYFLLVVVLLAGTATILFWSQDYGRQIQQLEQRRQVFLQERLTNLRSEVESGELPGAPDVSVFISTNLLNSALSGLVHQRFKLPKEQLSIELLDATCEFSYGVPGLAVKLSVHDNSSGLDAESVVRAYLDHQLRSDPEPELRLSIRLDEIVPNIKWRRYQFGLGRLAGKILTLKAADVVDSLPPLRAGLQRELSFDFEGINEKITIPTEGSITGKISSPALKLSLPLNAGKVVCLSQGLWISISAGAPATHASKPKPVAPVVDANGEKTDELLDQAFKSLAGEDVSIKISQRAFAKLSEELPDKYVVTFASTEAKGKIASGSKDITWAPDPHYSVRLKKDDSLKGKVEIKDMRINWDVPRGISFVGDLKFNANADLHAEANWAFLSIGKDPDAKFSLHEPFELRLGLSPLQSGEIDAVLSLHRPRKVKVSADVDISKFPDLHPKFTVDVPFTKLTSARVPRLLTFTGIVKLPDGQARYQMELTSPRIEYDKVGTVLASKAKLSWSAVEKSQVNNN